MRTPPAAAALALVIAFTPIAAYGQCIEVVDDGGAPSVANPEVDVKQVVRLGPAARTSMPQNSFAYVEIVREGGTERIDGKDVSRQRETFIRMLRGPNWATPFTFSRDGAHTLRGFVSTKYDWPNPIDVTTLTPLCSGATTNVNVDPPVRRKDFPGIRGQWWGAYRLPARLELGGSFFIRRLGFASSAELTLPRAIGDRDDPGNINPVTGAFEIRYRGSRGYIGGGARYYPDAEPDRDHWRPGFFAGEELPSFKGRRLWLLSDLSFEERRQNFLKGLRVTFGIRVDLWGSQP